MRKSRFTEAQIIGMIKEQEAGIVLRHGYETALCACYAAILIPMAAWVSRPFCSARI